jgi:hypothetical protein
MTEQTEQIIFLCVLPFQVTNMQGLSMHVNGNGQPRRRQSAR